MKRTDTRENITISIASHKPNKRAVRGKRELFILGLCKQSLDGFLTRIWLNGIKCQTEDLRSFTNPNSVFAKHTSNYSPAASYPCSSLSLAEWTVSHLGFYIKG